MLLIVFLTFLSAHPAFAANGIRAVTGQLNLLATISGEPAFKPVMWELRRQANLRTTEMVINRHSAVVDLEAGDYLISASLGNVTKTQLITIKEGGKHKLVVNLW